MDDKDTYIFIQPDMITKDKEPEYVEWNHSIEYENEQLLEKVEQIGALSDDEIKDIIKREHSMLINGDSTSKKLLLNKRFLEILYSVIGSLNLTIDEIIEINSLAYSYMTVESKIEEISDLLYNISILIDQTLIYRLSAYIPISEARKIAVVRMSSNKIREVVQRINYFLIYSNIEIDIQKVINIFCTIYDHFSYPFTYTMIETPSISYTEKQKDKFDIISAAIIVMIDNMDNNNLRQVLLDYGYTCRCENITETRFPLKKLVSYPRLQWLIKDAEQNSLEELVIK